MGFFQELKRRNVVRVGIAYALIAWVVLQALDFLSQLIGAPAWVLQLATAIAVLGLLPALVISWVYELTPQGIRREAELDRSQLVTPETGRKLDRVIILFLVLVVALLLAERFAPAGSETPATAASPATTPAKAAQATATEPAAPETSIAVLPFVNMSNDEDNEFFSDGVAEELLNVLARIPELKVAARTSAFSFKGSNATVADIARELGVNHILEGSVRKAGSQVRVTAQLIKAGDGFHLWSETYDRELDNIFAIQDEIAGQIAEALKVNLMLSQPGADNLTGTTSLQAYEYYLKGMSLWHQRTADSLYAAIEAFEAAVALDPNFARGWSGLALAWVVIDGYTSEDPGVTFINAQQAANRALAIDPDNAEALTALAQTKRAAAEVAEALALMNRAIELSPSFATAYQWRGRQYGAMGDFDAALDSYRRALELDPRSRIIAANYAWFLARQGEYDQATAANEAMLEWAPDFLTGLEQALFFNMLSSNCAALEANARRSAARSGKPLSGLGAYQDYCQGEDPQRRQASVEQFLGWGSTEQFHDSQHPALNAPVEIFFILVEGGSHDAAFELMQQLPTTGSYSDLWLSGWGTEQWRSYACRPDVRQWMATQNLAFPLTAQTRAVGASHAREVFC